MKALKKVFILTIVMAMGAVMQGQAFAKGGFGRGMGQGQAVNGDIADNQASEFKRGRGLGNGMGPVVNILEGEPVVVSGAIAEIGYYGQGVQIDNGTEIITVYGIGPVMYWEQLEVPYPVVADTIIVNGSKVVFSDGSEKIIALSVTAGQDEIALRDAETGFPLWHQGQGGVRGQGSMFPCTAIPAAE
ncbi:Uncharacterized protein dnl_45600 [Desulfonema limicola]|uniref:Uncharacterized protein n=1 Tax=Desulfonema limicola TaxID=45656 RepID=A0A975BAT1_9BACT|nr:hypothetical protein [Desulfonema limicola]QTA82189.1 Uncharacterized protein dnl_45600 [Desulfonema limicola]